MERHTYPSDVSDDEWSFVAPYLMLMTEDAPQREHHLREVFNGLRWIVRTGAQWRLMPHDLPPWAAVYQQTQRWRETQASLKPLWRICEPYCGWPKGESKSHRRRSRDSRTLQSSPESGHRAGYDGAKRRKGSKVHLAVDTDVDICWHCTSRPPMNRIVPR
jgi:transposase